MTVAAARTRPPAPRAWTAVPCENPVGGPRPRSHHAGAVYRDCLYILHGRDGTIKLGDFHEFSFAARRWRNVPAAGLAPIARWGHSCVVHEDALYVFGGFDGSVFLNDFSKYNFLTQQWSTIARSLRTPPPAARMNHSAVVHNNSMFCFGGVTQAWQGQPTNAMHEFNFDTGLWAPVQATGNAPLPRHMASFVVRENSGILFGGHDAQGFFNDVHLFDFALRAWSTPVIAGPPPSPRRGHVAVIHSNAMYIFGGGKTHTTMNDLHKLAIDPSSGVHTWQQVVSPTEPPPRAVFAHVGVVHNANLVVFGGFDSHDSTNDFMQHSLGPESRRHTENVREIPEGSLIAHLRNLVNNELTSDITFVVDGAPIYAHKYMCLRCDYFKAMLTSDMIESRAREIALPDVSRPTFLLFLEYLYTDDVDLSPESAMELLVIADRYGVERLQRICEQQVLASLSVDNAASILYQADLHNATALRGECVSFMLENFDTVSKTTAFEDMSHKNVALVLELLKLR